MSTFSGYGMGPKGFLVNRPLNDYEQEHRFDIKKPASDKVHRPPAPQNRSLRPAAQHPGRAVA